MTTLRRGFKTESNVYSRALRHELQLNECDPLCPWRLAEHLEIPVIPLSGLLQYEPEGVRYLLGVGRELFSAVTIFVGRYGRMRLIFHNDAHSRARQASNLAHELAHAILCHPPTPPFVTNQMAESEAKWLGPALLVSNEAALHIVENSMPIDSAAASYGVSSQLLQMRLNVSGARIRVARRK